VKLARARELHSGVILVEDGDLVRDEQLGVLRGPSPLFKGNATW